MKTRNVIKELFSDYGFYGGIGVILAGFGLLNYIAIENNVPSAYSIEVSYFFLIVGMALGCFIPLILYCFKDYFVRY